MLTDYEIGNGMENNYMVLITSVKYLLMKHFRVPQPRVKIKSKEPPRILSITKHASPCVDSFIRVQFHPNSKIITEHLLTTLNSMYGGL